MDARPPGSYLAISHVSENGAPGYAPEQRFFDGLDMVDPGLVPLHEWHPGRADLAVLPNIGGLTRKP